MWKRVSLVSMAAVLSVTVVCWAQVGVWWSKATHRATAAVFSDEDVQAAAIQRFAAGNALLGIQVEPLGPVSGGKEYEVRLIFDPSGVVPDGGDVTAVVFVSNDLGIAYVVSHEDPAPFPEPNPGGGEINNSIEYLAATTAFDDGEVQATLDERFNEDVNFTDVDVVILSVGEEGTTVEVRMDSDSQEPGLGDVTATVLVVGLTGTVTQVTGE